MIPKIIQVNKMLWEEKNSNQTSLFSNRNENNEKGLYSRRFMVYNHKTDPKGNKVIKETTTDNRSTYWGPGIQK